MAEPTDNTGTNPTQDLQDDEILTALINGHDEGDVLALQIVRGGLARTQEAIEHRAKRIIAMVTTQLPNGDFRVDDSPLAQDAFALVALLGRTVQEQEAVRHWTARIQAVRS